jgi:ATP-dependent Clp protease ATP-binding subunit ClpA
MPLAAKGFDPIFGARPVKRAIQRELETPLAQALLRGDVEVGLMKQWCLCMHEHERA